jgi:thiamine-phosphate pyrophosphorylase
MICLVTDRRRVSAGPHALDRLIELVTSAGRAGVDLIQVRERDLDARDLAQLVERCLRAVEGTKAKVVVNDRADVALAAGAHGVHLRADSIATSRIRSLLPSGALVGRSVHSSREASQVVRQGALDYLIFGTLFETASKGAGHRLATLDELADACRSAAAVPVLAIGGMSTERAPLVRRTGASGVAGISLFIPPPGRDAEMHVHAVVTELRRTFDTCEAVS